MILILAHDAYDQMLRIDTELEDGCMRYGRGLVTEQPLLPGDIVILPTWYNAKSIHEKTGWIPGTALRVMQVKNEWKGNRYPRGDNFATIDARELSANEAQALAWIEQYYTDAKDYTLIESHAPTTDCQCTVCGTPFRAIIPNEQDCSTLCREKRIMFNTGLTADRELLKAI